MKINRQKVFEKFNGHCAYCGDELELKKMHVDHILARLRGGENNYSNYNPACISCNASKSTYTIEEFRERLIADVDRLRRDSAKFRILERFGIVSQTKTVLKFYFEK